MKRLATIFVMLTAGLSGVLYWLDLTRCTSPDTGFVTVGPVVLRYVVMAAVLGLCALAARLLAARRPQALTRPSLPMGVCALLCGIAFALCGGLGLAGGRVGPRSYQLLNLLFLVSALWLLLVGMSRLQRTVQPPTGSAVWGVAGTMSLYLLTVVRFGFKPTGLDRVAPTVQVFAVLMALLFLTALARALYLPGAPCGRWLYFTGTGAFFLCTCLELPQTLFFWQLGTSGVDQLAVGLVLSLIGVLGAVSALAAASGESITPLEEAVAQVEPGE